MTGRSAPAPRTFTFAGSGKTVTIRRISPELPRRIRAEDAKRTPPPTPPLEDVQYGTKTVQQPNKLHPLYVSLHHEWQQEHLRRVSDAIFRYLVMHGIEAELDETALTEIAAVKQNLAAAGLPIEDENDHYVYILYVCITSDDEIDQLRDAILRGSMPTEEAVQEAVETFRGDLQGA